MTSPASTLQSCADSLSDGEPVEFGLDDEQGSWATRSRAGDSVVSGSMWGGPERGALDGVCDQFFSGTEPGRKRHHVDNEHPLLPCASDFGEDVNPHHAFHRAGGYHQDGQTMLSSGSRGGGGQVMTPTHNRLQNEVPQERLQALLQGLRESKHMQEQSHVAGEAAISTSLSYGRYVQADNTPTDLSYVLSSLLSGTISDPRVLRSLLSAKLLDPQSQKILQIVLRRRIQALGLTVEDIQAGRYSVQEKEQHQAEGSASFQDHSDGGTGRSMFSASSSRQGREQHCPPSDVGDQVPFTGKRTFSAATAMEPGAAGAGGWFDMGVHHDVATRTELGFQPETHGMSRHPQSHSFQPWGDSLQHPGQYQQQPQEPAGEDSQHLVPPPEPPRFWGEYSSNRVGMSGPRRYFPLQPSNGDGMPALPAWENTFPSDPDTASSREMFPPDPPPPSSSYPPSSVGPLQQQQHQQGQHPPWDSYFTGGGGSGVATQASSSGVGARTATLHMHDESSAFAPSLPVSTSATASHSGSGDPQTRRKQEAGKYTLPSSISTSRSPGDMSSSQPSVRFTMGGGPEMLPPKRSRLEWTSELHSRFLSVVETLGGKDNAKPKRILSMLLDDTAWEVSTSMLLRGVSLTVTQVRSHLQKLRREASPPSKPV